MMKNYFFYSAKLLSSNKKIICKNHGKDGRVFTYYVLLDNDIAK